MDFTPHTNLSGGILLSHPKQTGDYFEKSVVLISLHDKKEGVVGVIINRPLDKTLKDIDIPIEYKELKNVEVYEGGPTAKNQIILTAWNWSAENHHFEFHFGITQERAVELMENPDVYIRGFLGYAGWKDSQIIREIQSEAWIPAPVAPIAIKGHLRTNMWLKYIISMRVDLSLMAHMPKDPSLN